jgi:oxygen-independent coproporphyrinogen III oxidase
MHDKAHDSQLKTFFQALEKEKFSSLYFHFPFCETKCHYCDFYSIAAHRIKPNEPSLFENSLKKEVESWLPQISPVLDTIFMGGGTPSMTDPESMQRSLESLWNVSSLADDAEWTMEANPSSIDPERLKNYRGLGVNRISMGVQATKNELLLKLGRVHDRNAALRALGAIFEAGFDNASVDLLCGVPGQTLSDIEEALQTLTSFPITHLSCYLLTLGPKHKMAKDLPNEETQVEHLVFVHDWLTQNGFEHYEISNFCRKGKRARHNLHYWQGKSYLSFGPSAHSFSKDAKLRWKNFSSLHRYSEALLEKGELPTEWTETLTPEQEDLEKWMLALRLTEGFPRNWLKQSYQKAKAEKFLEERFLEIHPEKSDYLRPTPLGFFVSDQLVKDLA